MNGIPSDRVTLEVSDGVAWLTFVRGDRLNAIDVAMHAALWDGLEAAAADASVRAVVLAGSGRAFSAGQDLDERAEAFDRGQTPDLHASLDRRYNPLIRRIAQLNIPVIAAVNGIAFGGGAALAIACDIVLAGRSARFQFGFVNVGLGPDSGASWFLPRIVGQQRAMELMLSGRQVDAAEAVAIGLASRVLPDRELASAARQLARKLAAASPQAVAAIKRQIRANPDLGLDQALDAERDAQSQLSRTDGYRDAILRFVRR